ncbi:MAG: RDD family protein [Planctomycetota bacterium]|nr:RDD family protein [Planctomycetota bacterium]
MNAQNSIDLTAVITTPENIQFEYRIAGPFRRLPAFFLDFVLRSVFVSAFFILMLLVGATAALPTGMIFFVIFLVSFAFDWFYGLFFESYWNGQTPGKWLTRIRVISVDGRPINAYQATVRNFLRLADFAPMVSFEVFSSDSPPVYAIPTFLVSLLCMTISPRFQRLGDLAAGTMVVVNQRSWVPANIKLEDTRVASLSELIPPNFRMTSTLAKAIALYAERRSRLSIGRRTELASHLSQPLLKQFGLLRDTSPDLLLCALYYREFVAKDTFSDVKRFAPTPSADSTNEPVNAIASDSLPPILKAPQ